MLTTIIFNLLGILVFIFIFWRKLKEDYISDIIFNTAFYMLLGLAVLYFASMFLLPSYWFWLSGVGFTFGLAIGVFRFKLRLYETIEAATIASFPWLVLIFTADAIATSSISSFCSALGCALLIVLYLYLYKHYKNFSWYTSGRVGFSGLALLAIFFLLRATLAIFIPSVISFVKAEVLISGVLACAFLFLVFNLSKKKI